MRGGAEISLLGHESFQGLDFCRDITGLEGTEGTFDGSRVCEDVLDEGNRCRVIDLYKSLEVPACLPDLLQEIRILLPIAALVEG